MPLTRQLKRRDREFTGLSEREAGEILRFSQTGLRKSGPFGAV